LKKDGSDGMRLVKMMLNFFKKFRLLSSSERKIINHIRTDVGRKKEYKREDGFLPMPYDELKTAQGFVYEPSMDQRLKKLRLTGPYFRIWFTVEKNGDIYFVDFERLI